MDLSWIYTSGTAALMVVISSIGIYIALILFTRMAGLRSFSKMSSFDFAITIAFGAIIGTTILAEDPPLLRSIVGLASLYIIQIIVAKLRGRSTLMSKLVDNEPLLLMKGTEMLDHNLVKAKVTHGDIRAKLREANVTQMSQVQAVVMESTGDIAVLHHQDPNHKLDDILLKEVRGWEGIED